MWIDTYNFDNISSNVVVYSFREKVFINLSQISYITEESEFYLGIHLSNMGFFVVRKDELKKGFRRRAWLGDLL